MQRNPELLRDIMLAAEKQPAGQLLHISALRLHSCQDPHVLADHVQQLVELGFVDAQVNFHSPPTPPSGGIRRITSGGHDFLQAMRDDTLWKKVQDNVMKPAASWTIGLAIEYAKAEIARRLGLGPA